MRHKTKRCRDQSRFDKISALREHISAFTVENMLKRNSRGNNTYR